MQDVVVGAIMDFTFDQVKLWVNSLDRCGFSGKKLIFCDNISLNVVKELANRGYAVLGFDGGKNEDRTFAYSKTHSAFMTDRFLHLWYFLNKLDDKDNLRYLIATDVADIVFQRNPSEWLERNLGDKKINVASEAIRYQDEPWNSNNFYKSFGPLLHEMHKNNVVYNCGTLSGTFQPMVDLFLHIHLASSGFGRFNPEAKKVGRDQAALNVLLRTKTYRDITRFTNSEEGWAAQLAVTANPATMDTLRSFITEPSPTLVGDMVCTSSGEPYYLVHQYDRAPSAWREIIETKFASEPHCPLCTTVIEPRMDGFYARAHSRFEELEIIESELRMPAVAECTETIQALDAPPTITEDSSGNLAERVAELEQAAPPLFQQQVRCTPINKARVSVIIPFFNREQFLAETIDSVVAQTFKDWELLLVDDGSTDGSGQIALDYASRYPEKICYLCHEGHENRGVNPSRNLGFKNSRGDIILYLDSDDLLLPQKLEAHISIFDLHPEADAVFGETLVWHGWTGKSGDRLRDHSWAPWKASGIPTDTMIESTGLLRPLILESVMPFPCGLLLRREIVNRIGGWDEDYLYTFEDQAFFAKLFLHAPVYIAPGCYELYRRHDGSACNCALKAGRTLHDRIFFLNWVQRYLAEQDYHDAEIDGYLNKELQPYRNPLAGNRVEVPPPVGLKNFGDLHRLTPVSRVWGFDRCPSGEQAQAIDRYYIEAFLQRHAADINGRVLEIGKRRYSQRFGGDRVTLAEMLDVDPATDPTDQFDLAIGGEGFPREYYDCFVLAQTLPFTYDVRAAIGNAWATLRPGGVMLAILPGISRICRAETEQGEDYWRFTDASARRLFGDVFGLDNITVTTHGNVLAASAFLFGLASHEVKKEELDFNDPDYQVTITVRAVKGAKESIPFSSEGGADRGERVSQRK